MNEYSTNIAKLISEHPLGINTSVQVAGHTPAAVSSAFLINKEQGDWAENLVLTAFNKSYADYFAVHYGRDESLSAGDDGFDEYYAEYQKELNTIGKRPDILIFRKEDIPDGMKIDFLDDNFVRKAVAAIEVRSSSFLNLKYTQTMQEKVERTAQDCLAIIQVILSEPYGVLLKQKNETLYRNLASVNESNLHTLSFRCISWSASEDLQKLTDLLKKLKEKLSLLHKRDFLSITPKLEDIALVNRWIQRFGVPHYYLQVFFDSAYIISFEDILRISSDSSLSGMDFSLERDVKNQGKQTIKINVNRGKQVFSEISMPELKSFYKELSKGRLVFYVKFSGGHGVLNLTAFDEILK